MPGTAAGETAMRRRLSAVLALVFGAATVVAMTVFVFERLLTLIVADVLLIVGIATVWVALTERGFWRLVAAVAAVAVAVAMVVLLLSSQIVLGLVVVLLLLAASGVAARVALAHQRHRPAVRVAEVALSPVLFMNPRSGGGKVGQFDLVARAGQYGADVIVLDGDLDLRAEAEAAVARGADLLGAAGGDGTQALVAQVCADHGLPFLCIPAGTRNHFALDLGLDRDDPSLALSGLAVDAQELIVDLAEVSGRPFVNNVSMGVYAKVIQSPEYRDDKIGTFAELLPDLVGEGTEPFDLHCEGPDGPIDGPELLMVSNNPYRYRSLTDFGTRDRIDAGVLGVLAAQVNTATEAARVVRLSALGRVDRYEGWTTFAGPSLTVTSAAGTIDAGIDGEAVRLPSPAEFRIRAGALRVRVPRHRPGVRARPPRFGLATVGRLWAVAVRGG